LRCYAPIFVLFCVGVFNPSRYILARSLPSHVKQPRTLNFSSFPGGLRGPLFPSVKFELPPLDVRVAYSVLPVFGKPPFLSYDGPGVVPRYAMHPGPPARRKQFLFPFVVELPFFAPAALRHYVSRPLLSNRRRFFFLQICAAPSFAPASRDRLPLHFIPFFDSRPSLLNCWGNAPGSPPL